MIRGLAKGHVWATRDGGPQEPTKWTDEKLDDLADKLIEWMKKPGNFWLGEFALEQGLTRSNMAHIAYDRNPKHARFFHAYMLGRAIQEMKLVKMGLRKKEFDSPFVKFILENNHNWAERKELMHGVGELGELMDEIARRNEPWVKDPNRDEQDTSSQRSGDGEGAEGEGEGEEVEA